jgi:hypothetical protein
MTHESSPAVPVRAKEVLEHFLQNPQLVHQDLEEVARWRMPHELATLTFDHVRRALEWLVEEQYLEKIEKGMSIRFRLNKQREADAWKFVADPYWQLHGHTDEEEIRRNHLMGLAKRWIDATLVQHLKENPGAADDQPGLTRSRKSAEALLFSRVIVNNADLDSARRTAAEASRILLDALRSAGDEPLAILYHALNLTLPELQAVLLCLAPELDADYQTVYGVLNDDMSRRTPTLGLICRLLGDSLKVRTALAASVGLTRWRLIESAGAVLPHGDDQVRLDTALVCWLLGSPTALFSDGVVGRAIRLVPWPGGEWLESFGEQSVVERLALRFGQAGQEKTTRRWLALCGEDSDGWRAIVEKAAEKANVPLARIVPPTAAGEGFDWEDASARIFRAVLLLRAIPVLDLGLVNSDGNSELSRLVAVAAPLTLGDRLGVVIVRDLERIVGAIPVEQCDVERRSAPSNRALANVYIAAMSAAGLYLDSAEAMRIALAFPLSLDAIYRAVRLTTLTTSSDATFANQAAALTAACRKMAAPDLPQFARRLEPVFGLDDVILPANRLRQLQEIVAHVRFATHVLNTWGFGGQLPYGRGVVALFSGPSGTGKTMAAQAIARALGTETFVIDLSQVISKYIGETEKFIDATFRAAQRAGAVLQIDEAEALFGQRSEIKDSHDRYANIEVAYLLQRIEAFDGIAILTTNLQQNVDQAFLRRLRFVIDFPKPDVNAREKIWRQSLPKNAPASRLDFRYLARRLEITGGHIRTITIRAAFLAASEGSSTIEMRHIVYATRSELTKLGMVTAGKELAEWEAAQIA